MKNLFVPYETAKMAKDSGFNEPCLGWIASDGFLSTGFREVENSQCATDHCAAPLYQQLIDWLLLDKNILIRKDWNGRGYEVKSLEWAHSDFIWCKDKDAALKEAFKLIHTHCKT